MNVKELRIKLRMTQKEFATIVGVSEQSISAWENKIKKPSLRSLKVIEKKFEVKLKY